MTTEAENRVIFLAEKAGFLPALVRSVTTSRDITIEIYTNPNDEVGAAADYVSACNYAVVKRRNYPIE